MANLEVNIAGVSFKNPVIAASGTFGYGREYANLFPLEKLGGIATKGTTLEQRNGNLAPRIAESYSGILNAVGLQNPGVKKFMSVELPWLSTQNTRIIANIAGANIEEYGEVCRRLNDSSVDMIEVNVSCPNVKEGGVAFGVSCEGVEAVTKICRSATDKPLIIKLSPNVTSIVDMAKAAESAGADGVSLINTLLGMRIDIRSRRPILKNNTGGLSGPAVFPVALRMVWQTASAVSIPVIGMGGISGWEDAVEMLMAGAAAIQMGSAFFADPLCGVKTVEGLNDYLDENGIASVSELRGTVKPW